MSYLEKLIYFAQNQIPSCSAAQMIGYRVLEAEKGRVVVGLEKTENFHNPIGTVHGGIISLIADAAMGYAFSTTLAEDEISTTVELKINFLKAPTSQALRAESKIIKRGSTLGLLECSVIDEEGKLIAYATSTCIVLKKKQ
ncbi:PaaI family thioesterase [Ureibacillus thermophilus]|uniref:PaaI family thioesterase n=1 Tax=Ureibacillus thermophilus TaxID=367743 RepID=A0A4P6UT34_9BACL|nr:PaaI family thioesterase [Ureibacillus thermophilus]QBK26323.1 PaaI family thioesterase [Ureibacillus thermophilus]